MDDIIESWQPPAGTRVRARISGECRTRIGYQTGNDFGDPEIERMGHDMAEDGVVGTVIWVDEYMSPGMEPTLAAHRYQVEFDDEIIVSVTDYPQSVQFFAAAELEPIPERQ